MTSIEDTNKMATSLGARPDMPPDDADGDASPAKAGRKPPTMMVVPDKPPEEKLDDDETGESSGTAQAAGAAGADPDDTPASTIAVSGASSESNLFPRPAAVSMDHVVDEDDFEPLAEAVRYVLARPQLTVNKALPARIAVVSALPGEGVTTVSSVFATVLSNDSGVETCRIDLSWKPGSKAGVYEVLTGTAELDDVLEWNGPSATLHSGGLGPYEQHRLARSGELEALIEILAARFKHVVLDIPALLEGSDGLSMMRLADAYLLVVQHGVTTLDQVQAVTEQLADTETLGSVLNRFRTRTPRPLSRWLAG